MLCCYLCFICKFTKKSNNNRTQTNVQQIQEGKKKLNKTKEKVKQLLKLYFWKYLYVGYSVFCALEQFIFFWCMNLLLSAYNLMYT